MKNRSEAWEKVQGTVMGSAQCTPGFQVGDRVFATRTITLGREGPQIAYGERGVVREVDEAAGTVWVEWDVDGFRYQHNPAHLGYVNSAKREGR